MVNEKKTPARQGADLVVGVLAFCIFLPMLWRARFGEGTKTAICAAMPVSFANAVADVQMLESGNVSSSSQLKFGERGFGASLMRIFASIIENGLPIVINVASAVGSAIITVFLAGKAKITELLALWFGWGADRVGTSSSDVSRLKKENQFLNRRIADAEESIKAAKSELNEGALKSYLKEIDERLSTVETLLSQQPAVATPNEDEIISEISELKSLLTERLPKKRATRTTKTTTESSK